MKKLLNHLKSDWYRYVIEIIVVVLSILIAFTLDNWNEKRKSKIEELEVLSNIRNALYSDIENQFKRHLERAARDIDRTNVIIYYLDNNLPYNDSLRFHFAVLSATGGKIWTPSLTAYRILESKGLDLIENDNLINSILNIYNIDYPRIEITFENYLNNIYEYGRPIARSQFRWQPNDNGFEGMTPIDFNDLSKDVEFVNTILVLRTNSIQIRDYLTEFKANVEGVIEEINKELELH